MKITNVLIAIALGVVIAFSGCGGSSNTIKLNEVTHSIFYAPLYIAINNGYFEDEDIEIELINGGGSDKSMTALISGQAQVALLGPETAVYVAAQGSTDQPIIFGQLTKRDGTLLIGREAEPNFDWADLAGKEILGGRRGGMPAMTLEYVLKQNGVGDTARINLDVAFDLMVSAFENGTADYCTMFEPTASDYVAAGKGYVVASIGQESGEVPYTAFMATPSWLNDNPDKAEGFLTAFMRGYEYLMTAEINDVVDSLMPSFTGSTRTSIQSAVESYKSIDAWVDNPAMKESAYNNLLDIISSAGELTERVPFSTVVDNTIANKVAQKFVA